MKSTVENGTYFKSIAGLAYGKYAYMLKQFDKNDNLLLETELIEFDIKRLDLPRTNYYPRPLVIN